MENCNRIGCSTRNQGSQGRGSGRSRKRKAVVCNVMEAEVDMIAETRMKGTKGWEAGYRWWKETHMTTANVYPATCMDSILVESRGSRAQLQLPRISTLMESEVSERNSTVEASRQRNHEKEAGQFEIGREEVNEVKDRTEPKQLVRKAGVRAAAVDACNPRLMIEEPIQSWIQKGGIEDSKGA